MKYSILIQWSDPDQAYIASLPEWGNTAHVHGASYEEAAKNGCEALSALVSGFESIEKHLPSPNLFRQNAYTTGTWEQFVALNGNRVAAEKAEGTGE
jgi:predicted RNase H-like HicB family nuclease